MKIRADELLVLQKSAQTRSQAKQLIKQGVVFYSGKQITKPAQLLNQTDKLKLTTQEQYVGRGAVKLKAAIEEFNINPQDKIAADFGASTGGFTDYLLQKGAQKVYAIDVGHSQLAPKLRNNPQVINMEKTNIKDVISLPEQPEIIVIDLSFISLRHAIEKAVDFLKPNGDIIALFKPQFEAGKDALRKDGTIKDPEIAKQALQDFESWCHTKNIQIKQSILCPITGKKGNQEYLLHL